MQKFNKKVIKEMTKDFKKNSLRETLLKIFLISKSFNIFTPPLIALLPELINYKEEKDLKENMKKFKKRYQKILMD